MTTFAHEFPDCFPPEFVDEILPKGLVPQIIDVYRICTRGIIDKTAFLSTYEEICLNLKPKPRPQKWEKMIHDPGTYSTSCYEEKNDVINALKCLTAYYPNPILIQGHASFEYGPFQRTSERKVQNDSHVDWWIFKDAYPNECGQFQIVETMDEVLE